MTHTIKNHDAVVESTIKMIGKMERNIHDTSERRGAMSTLIADTLRVHILPEYQAIVIAEHDMKEQTNFADYQALYGADAQPEYQALLLSEYLSNHQSGNKVLRLSDITDIVDAFDGPAERFIDNIVDASAQLRKIQDRIQDASPEAHQLMLPVRDIFDALFKKMDTCSL